MPTYLIHQHQQPNHQVLYGRQEHTLHRSLNPLHSPQNLAEPLINLRPRAARLEGIDDLDGAADQLGGVLDHVDVGQDEAGLGALGVKAALKGADQAQVRVLQALGGVGQVVVEEGVCAGIGEEGGDVQAGEVSLALSVMVTPSARGRTGVG